MDELHKTIVIGFILGFLFYDLVLVVGAMSEGGDISQDPSLKYRTGLEPTPAGTSSPTPTDTEQPTVTTQKVDHDLSSSAPPVVDTGY